MRSYRRIFLDEDLSKIKKFMRNQILDIGGGRKRGNFEPPRNVSWINLDLEKKFFPNIIGDAQNLPIKPKSLDCVKCTELLEHIEFPEIVIKEISRVLKSGGILILSTPFNFRIHGDPYDFHRFTDEKLKRMLKEDFNILLIKKQGLYLSVISHFVKDWITNWKSKLRYLFYPIFPILNLLIKKEKSQSIRNSEYIESYTTGFFILAKKKIK